MRSNSLTKINNYDPYYTGLPIDIDSVSYIILIFILILIIYILKIYNTQIVSIIIMILIKSILQILIVGYVLYFINIMNYNWILIIIISLIFIYLISIIIYNNITYIHKYIIIDIYITLFLSNYIILYITLLFLPIDIFTIRYFITILSILLFNSCNTIIKTIEYFNIYIKPDIINLYLSNGASNYEATIDLLIISSKLSISIILYKIEIITLITLPGLFCGILISAANPLVAMKWQMLIVTLLFVSQVLCSIIMSYFLIRAVIKDDFYDDSIITRKGKSLDFIVLGLKYVFKYLPKSMQDQIKKSIVVKQNKVLRKKPTESPKIVQTPATTLSVSKKSHSKKNSDPIKPFSFSFNENSSIHSIDSQGKSTEDDEDFLVVGKHDIIKPKKLYNLYDLHENAEHSQSYIEKSKTDTLNADILVDNNTLSSLSSAFVDSTTNQFLYNTPEEEYLIVDRAYTDNEVVCDEILEKIKNEDDSSSVGSISDYIECNREDEELDSKKFNFDSNEFKLEQSVYDNFSTLPAINSSDSSAAEFDRLNTISNISLSNYTNVDFKNSMDMLNDDPESILKNIEPFDFTEIPKANDFEPEIVNLTQVKNLPKHVDVSEFDEFRLKQAELARRKKELEELKVADAVRKLSAPEPFTSKFSAPFQNELVARRSSIDQIYKQKEKHKSLQEKLKKEMKDEIKWKEERLRLKQKHTALKIELFEKFKSIDSVNKKETLNNTKLSLNLDETGSRDSFIFLDPTNERELFTPKTDDYDFEQQLTKQLNPSKSNNNFEFASPDNPPLSMLIPSHIDDAPKIPSSFESPINKKYSTAKPQEFPNIFPLNTLEPPTMSRSHSNSSIDSQFKNNSKVTTPKKTIIVNKNIESPLVELKSIRNSFKNILYHLRALLQIMPINEEQIINALKLFSELVDLKATSVSYDRFCNLLNVKSTNELVVLFGIFDGNTSGRVDFKDFCICLIVYFNSLKQDLIGIKTIFDLYDTSLGFILEIDLIKLIKASNIISLKEAKNLLSKYYTVLDNRIPYTDFALLCKHELIIPSYDSQTIIIHEKLGFGSSSVKLK